MNNNEINSRNEVQIQKANKLNVISIVASLLTIGLIILNIASFIIASNIPDDENGLLFFITVLLSIFPFMIGFVLSIISIANYKNKKEYSENTNTKAKINKVFYKLNWSVVILSALCFVAYQVWSIVIYIQDETQDDENETQYEEEVSPGYSTVYVESYDKSTNGKIVYNQSTSDEIDYANFPLVEISTHDGEYNYSFGIEDSKLTVVDKNKNKKVIIDNIGPVKSIIKAQGFEENAQGVIILTNSGKVYIYFFTITEDSKPSKDIENIKNELVEIKTNLSIQKIGYMTDNRTNIGLLSTDEKKYRVSINLYQKEYGKIESVAPFYDTYNLSILNPYACMYINFDASLTYDDKQLVDNNGNIIYIQYAFTDKSNEKIYIIDRQGYLYELTNKYEKLQASEKSKEKVILFQIENNYDPKNTEYEKEIGLQLKFANKKISKYKVLNSKVFGL